MAESFCPKGTIAQVLNQFILVYLNNGFVNLDGFGQVTPAQITAINEQLVVLQNEISALNKVTQRGNAGLITGYQTVAVAFSTNMPSALYDISITPLDTGGMANTPFSWALIDGSKSASGFSIRWQDVPASVDSFDWKAEEQ